MTKTNKFSPEVRERAAREWNTMGLELGEVPPFDECYAAARAFYRELPWDGG